MLDTLTKLLSTSESDTAENAAISAKKMEGPPENCEFSIYLLPSQFILSAYLGKNTFERMLLALPADQQKDYARFSKNITIAQPNPSQNGRLTALGTTSTHSSKIVVPGTIFPPSQPANRNNMKLVSGERRFRFGIIPSLVAAMVIDNADSATRISGLEKVGKQLC